MISIITPVFQCEDYLQTLIESIICQTYTDWELLLIDDGSKDGSPEICDRYARENPRIRVVHRTNGGPAAARNEAVAMARGEYVAFADSDDWTEPRWLELLHATARERQADIVSATSSRSMPTKPSGKESATTRWS
ncbi:glycosyltransferase family 2 protein [Prevotella dentasini]|uniref:glycosyltransferase family 2 protein n=1 Tax=Prevotella dentasini TaxID=589537 RepID=UPI00046928F4|nr:glycosyltransferase family A protein [Prevotella dentasini]